MPRSSLKHNKLETSEIFIAAADKNNILFLSLGLSRVSVTSFEGSKKLYSSVGFITLENTQNRYF